MCVIWDYRRIQRIYCSGSKILKYFYLQFEGRESSSPYWRCVIFLVSFFSIHIWQAPWKNISSSIKKVQSIGSRECAESPDIVNITVNSKWKDFFFIDVSSVHLEWGTLSLVSWMESDFPTSQKVLLKTYKQIWQSCLRTERHPVFDSWFL